MSCDSTDGDHPINQLRRWAQHRFADSDCAPGSVPIPAPIHGSAFFAAGPGLWLGDRGDLPLPAFPTGGVMFVGDAVGSERGYRQWVDAGGASTVMPTWAGMKTLLSGAALPWEECFLTNIFVGLVVGDQNMRRHPGRQPRYQEFRQLCWEFLLEQLRVMRPRLVVVLGKEPALFLGSHALGLDIWDRNLRELSTGETAVREMTTLAGDFRALLLVHPSRYGMKGLMRQWRGVEDASVEVALLRAALL